MKRLTIAFILALTLGVAACNDSTATKETPGPTSTQSFSVATQSSPTSATVPAGGSQSVPCEGAVCTNPNHGAG